ncbi:MAG TPA: hypothetical protein DDW50_04710 [Firmicutes bacterium]|nr:hypothetical protein [Bacillota bacterium]
MLLNMDMQIPDTFYIFISKYNPSTAHLLKTNRQFSSASISNCALDKGFLDKYINGTINYIPFEPRQSELGIVSPYGLRAISDYAVEYDAEYYRLKYFSLYPSRLSAIYAFGNYESCQLVNQKYPNNWDLNTVKKFKLENTLPSLTRVVKLNMEIVSLARLAYTIFSLNEEIRESIWKSYWSGSGNIALELPGANFERTVYNSGEIYEYLIEGIVKLDDQENGDAVPGC